MRVDRPLKQNLVEGGLKIIIEDSEITGFLGFYSIKLFTVTS